MIKPSCPSHAGSLKNGRLKEIMRLNFDNQTEGLMMKMEDGRINKSTHGQRD
jgi:hypothetical protein